MPNLNQYQYLSQTPQVGIQRSKFHKPFDHKFTFKAGDLVPFIIEDCLPASTYSCDTSFVCRMLTPIFPVMDNAYLDVFYFFVPYRLLWDHWKEFNGENTSGPWIQQQQYNVPHIKPPVTPSSGLPLGFPAKSLMDYFGFPVGVPTSISVSAFPSRAYALIWNEWFRNENTDNFALFSKGDSDYAWTGDTAAPCYGGSLLQVSREHDYFSDCLPSAQKGEAATIPLGDLGVVPVSTGPAHVHSDVAHSASGATFGLVSGGSFSGQTYSGFNSTGALGDSSQVLSGSVIPVYPDNLQVDLTDVSAGTINELRQAFAIQRYLERLAYGGSRYTEQLYSFYHLTTQDSRLQRPEFLGSQRFRINMSQVLQTSSTDSTSPQGNTAAYSMTTGSGAHFTYSTQEHGIIMGLCCVRHDRTYQQGIERSWSRRNLYDFYNPAFAHLGNQAVLNKEIYCGNGADLDGVFGYQEAWAEYRYKPSQISGELRSTYKETLDSWHYGDYYTEMPILSESWMRETPAEIARTLAVQETGTGAYEDQFIADFYVDMTATLPMPLHSVPGLADHF